MLFFRSEQQHFLSKTSDFQFRTVKELDIFFNYAKERNKSCYSVQ